MQKKTYSIVGTNHTGKEAFVNGLETGTAVVLVREPRNQYDPMAIAVYIGGERVGYIPKRQNQVLANFIDDVGQPYEQPALAQDGATTAKPVRWDKSIPATFVRSPTSAFPLVEV